MTFINLKRELEAAGIHHAQIAAAINTSRAAANMKINEKRAITIDEAKCIKQMFFPEHSLDYLFESDKSERFDNATLSKRKRRAISKRKVTPKKGDELYWVVKQERLFDVWRSMHSRCGVAQGYKDVKVCDEWYDYLNFREWSYANGYDDQAPFGQCTIDRIDPYGDYEPSNCRWADMKTQANNKRKKTQKSKGRRNGKTLSKH